jgi:hypothetical protein
MCTIPPVLFYDVGDGEVHRGARSSVGAERDILPAPIIIRLSLFFYMIVI